MLVLTRKPNESIMIGDDVEVSVVEIRGDQVKLGIKAPRNLVVHRKEIFLAIQNENIDASRSTTERMGEIGGIFRKRKK
jgi:carbon storage regulator